jgi:hypothetical protein
MGASRCYTTASSATCATSSYWYYSYGGYDSPDPGSRRDFIQINFVPHQNPFYVALPYNDVEGLRPVGRPCARPLCITRSGPQGSGLHLSAKDPVGSAVTTSRCRGGLVLFSDEIDPDCVELETLDFGPPVQPGFDLGKPSALSKGAPTKTTTIISQLFPTKPLIAGLLPDLSGSANAYIR